jgi:hypothetical protein
LSQCRAPLSPNQSAKNSGHFRTRSVGRAPADTNGIRAHPKNNRVTYGCDAGMGRMLDTFQPSAVFTTTWFIRKRIG